MENSKIFRPDPDLRLMEQVRQVLRYHHYAYRTEQTYCDWIKRYIRYHGGKTHPRKMGKKEIEAFLSHLAVQKNVAAATQRQALNAIVFLYKKVLDIPVDENLEPVRAKRSPRPPVVMSQREGLLFRLKRLKNCTSRTWGMVTGKSIFPTPLPENTQMRPNPSVGNMCSLQKNAARIHARAKQGVIMCWNPDFKKR